ncbi:hypothetical protein K458DRAFT_391798 [Lentithecium fluviatile CBS 122367]|uniref:N-acetyltransferase domain-containing protein n=1 Tax=Lentithecium fluviatile CBS 122367 TaxID=1168545 RepID=A0A6G1IU61_9PLEO|nr:hypothetical protein K458DRAFT_391798 [Lentithecium fluviatile CBS 122367]
MDWGLQIANEKNALCLVESTQVAKKLYKTGGFLIERDYHLDAGEKFADRPKDRPIFVVRPRPGAH